MLWSAGIIDKPTTATGTAKLMMQTIEIELPGANAPVYWQHQITLPSKRHTHRIHLSTSIKHYIHTAKKRNNISLHSNKISPFTQHIHPS